MPEPSPNIRAMLEKLPIGLPAFRFDSIQNDLLAAQDAFADHLVPDSQQLLKSLTNNLTNVASVNGENASWGTPLERPLRTQASDGQHQCGRKGHGRSLYATVGFTWALRLVDQPNAKKPLHRWFGLANSSVRVKLHDEKADNAVVAWWDFDAGNHESPGCHFHCKAHPLGDLEGGAVDVPRLPGLLFMPSDALDFVCGELWQEEWPNVVAANTPQMNKWRPLALGRMRTLLGWYAEVAKDSSLSGWMCLKRAKPKALNLLVMP